MKSQIYSLIMFSLTSLILAQDSPKVTTLEEYDALPHEQKHKAYFNLPKEVLDKIHARDAADLKESQRLADEVKKKMSNIFHSGISPMKDVQLLEEDMKKAVLKKQYPDPADERGIKGLKAIDDQLRSEWKVLSKTANIPKVEVWSKHKARFDEFWKKYPPEKWSVESVEALEKEVESLLADVRKLPPCDDQAEFKLIMDSVKDAEK